MGSPSIVSAISVSVVTIVTSLFCTLIGDVTPAEKIGISAVVETIGRSVDERGGVGVVSGSFGVSGKPGAVFAILLGNMIELYKYNYWNLFR